MIAIFFIYGLAFFCLGFAVALEARRASDLPLGQQLPWLAAFGLVHALVEWSDMLILTGPEDPFLDILIFSRTVLLPLSAILLIRFGAGMIVDAGPLPKWLWFLPVVVVTPVAFLIAYALITATADPYIAIDVWSRYLLYFVGCILAGFGFLRQRRALPGAGLSEAGNLMVAAAMVFFFNALVAGLIVPASPYGLAPWLNYDFVMGATGLPVQFWRMLSAVALTIFVIRALDLFEAEREKQLLELETQRRQVEETLRESEERFRTIFEMAPIGVDIVSPFGQPIQANLALQQMLGYSVDELRSMVYTDYTHPDDILPSQNLVREITEGKREHFHLEKRYYNKDGSLVWANVAVSGVRDPAGELLYFIAMVEDITERKNIEETLRLERERALSAKLQAQAVAREAAENWLNSLVDISRRIANMENVDNVLLHIAREAKELVKSDCISIGLLDNDGAQLQLKYRVTDSDARVLEPPQAIEDHQLLEILSSGCSYQIPEDADRLQCCPTMAPDIQIAAMVPLQFDNRLIGGIWSGRLESAPFTPAEIVGLESLADQAVIALQHALMTARLQSLAVMEERSRIAREMHDGLAQILGYLGLQVQTLEALVRQGDREKALAELKKTLENIKNAQADVRENILSLRTTLSGDAGVLPALQEYVTEFGLQTGKTTDLVVQIKGPPKLSPLAEVQLVRIVQEALANVRKHAQAQSVQVLLSQHDDCLNVTVTDDGLGFLPSKGRQHFGLHTMRERAESVGGGLEVHSKPNQGTKVELWLPLLSD